MTVPPHGDRLPSFWPDSIAPDAEAVLDVVLNEAAPLDEQRQLRADVAAAIRVASGLVAQMRPHGGRAWTAEQAAAYDALSKAADHLAAIAAELEA